MASTKFRPRSIRRHAGFTSVLLALALLPLHAAAELETDDADLGSLSIEDLMDLEVTSVSKHAQPLSEAAAAVYVLTGEEIRRSGMTSIPEALRMVPGLAVARIDGSRWSITARGFNNQFANKLLVLIDGRSVYTPRRAVAVCLKCGGIYRYPSWRRRSFSASLSARSGARSDSEAMISAS